MTGRCLLGLYSVLVGLTALVSAVRSDWMAVLAGLFSVSVVYVYSQKGFKLPYRLFCLTTALFFVYLMVSVIDLTCGLPDASIRGIQYVWVFELFILSVIVFILGFFVALLIDRCTPSKMSFRWMLLVAIVSTIAFSAIDLFSLGFHLWYTGAPFGYDDIDTYGWEINVSLMVPSTCAIIVALASSLVGRVFLKDYTKESFLREV